MELDELKNTWTALDTILMKNESLKSTIIKEMLQSKANKSLSRLNNFELLGAVLCFIMLPFFFFMQGKMAHNLFADITFYIAVSMLFVGCITNPYKLYLLSKIDFSKSIADDIKFVQQYTIFINKEKKYAYIIIPIIFGLILCGLAGFKKVETWRWIAVVSAFVFSGVMLYWQYKRFYDTNIQSITKSLEELKELEE